MESQQVKVKSVAIGLISKYFGSNMADMYSKFYDSKDDSTVKLSISELLEDYLGKNEADKVIYSSGLGGNK